MSVLQSAPTARDFVRAAQKRKLRYALGGLLLSLAAALAYLTVEITPFILFAVLISILTPVLLWQRPRWALNAVFIAACTIELYETKAPDALTDRIPFFWNVNTIFQTYAHVNFKAIPLNLFECFILAAGVCALLRAVFTGTTKIQVGPLFWPIFAYIVFVVIAWANGMGTGGDFKISLQETRAQFYFLIAYLMAYNTVKERARLEWYLWAMALCVVLKGTLYTLREYVTYGGATIPDQGVGSHEEAFLFVCFVLLLLALALCGSRKKLQWVMMACLPLVLVGNLTTNRRAGTAALAILLPVLLLAAYRGLPERRKLVAIIGVSFIALFSVYYPIFKNKSGALAQPARAINSQFNPDPRDASSNAYRDAENANQYATIRANPLGYGYGKRFLHIYPMADISEQYEWWDILPHNQILWVWMRTGLLGFYAFWMMVASIVVFACRRIRDEELPNDLKAIALFGLLVMGALLMFGLLDLQLSNFRDMIFTGIWVGLIARLPDWGTPPSAKGAEPV